MLTEQQRRAAPGFDTDESPEVTGPLAAYLALFYIAGPRDLAAHVSAIPLGADVFSTWAATGPDLKSVVRLDGEQIICSELGTKFPPVAA